MTGFGPPVYKQGTEQWQRGDGGARDGLREASMTYLSLVFFFGVGCGMLAIMAPTSSKQGFAAAGEFPWVVSLQDRHHRHVAFGVILSKRWIISAASSFQNG